MTREEAKQMLPIIQAYAEGKEIQFKLEDKWINTKNPDLEFGVGTYRIKPVFTLRPFESAEECWNEMLKHQPFGWIKEKDQEIYLQVLSIDNEGVVLCDYEENTILYDHNYAMTLFTFADDKPFGINLSD